MNNSEKGILALVENIGGLEQQIEDFLEIIEEQGNKKKHFFDEWQKEKGLRSEAQFKIINLEVKLSLSQSKSAVLDAIIKELENDPRMKSKKLQDLIKTGKFIIDL